MEFKKLDLLEILRYDTVKGSNLTIIDRMMVHQQIAQGSTFSDVLQEKLEALHNRIMSMNWEAPRMRYYENDNGSLVLQAYDTSAGQWKILRKLNN